MALTEFAVRAAKPAAKDTKLFDERGLYLLVCANGSKLWRLKYRFSGREKLLSLGAYPDIGLKGARDAREEARKLLATGVDPKGLVQDLGPFHFTFGRTLLRLLLPLDASLSDMFDIFMEPRRRLIALHECGGAFRLLFVRYL
jgi:hypothetical protein